MSSEQQGYMKQAKRKPSVEVALGLFTLCSLDASVAAAGHAELATLHLTLVLLQLGGLLLLAGEQGSVLLLARAALLDAAKGHDEYQHGEQAEGAGDDADFGALGQGGPAVAHARGGLYFLRRCGLAASGVC
jgi:hypothetical protein